jgi:hypothetical protein
MDKNQDPGSSINIPDLPFNVLIFFFFCFRKVVFDLIVEKQVFLSGLETLERAINSFLHISFFANLTYPTGSGILSTFLQRWVAKLDKHGTVATHSKNDLVSKQDKKSLGRCFEKAFTDYAARLFVLLSGRR